MRKIYKILLLLVLPCVSFAQIPNLGMESWRTVYSGDSTPVAVQIPELWWGSDSLIIALGQTIGAIALNSHDTDWRRQIFQESASLYVHSGSFSAKIMTVREDSFLVPGVITNAMPNFTLSYPPPGVSTMQLSGGSPVTAKPTSVSAWIKYFSGTPISSLPVDSGMISVEAVNTYGGVDSIIGTGSFIIPPSSSWLHVTANITYTNQLLPVDTIRVSFSSGRGATSLDGSRLYVDDISMDSMPNPIYNAVTQIAGSDNVVTVYPNPSTGMIYLDCSTNESNCKLYSVNGQCVATQRIVARHNMLDMSSLPDGLYFYNIADENGNTVQRGKVAVSR